MGTGRPVAIAEVDEADVDQMIDWLAPLVEQIGTSGDRDR